MRIIISNNCTGCRLCELICVAEHENDKITRVNILESNNMIATPCVCIQCTERYCVNSCPVGALTIDSQMGIIRVNTMECIGCQACVNSCVYKGMKWNDKEGHPIVCDLCEGKTRCVMACTEDALTVINT